MNSRKNQRLQFLRQGGETVIRCSRQDFTQDAVRNEDDNSGSLPAGLKQPEPDAAQPIEELRRQDEELDEHKKILRAKKFSPSFVGLHTALPLFFYNRADNYF